MEGDVKFFNQKRGFGFINGEDGKDYFVHFSAVTPGVFLRENDRVSFDPKEDERGLKAQNVKLLQKGSERGGSSKSKGKKEESEEETEEPQEEEQTEKEYSEEEPEEEASEDEE